ncbi:putative Serine/threonine protein kinase [Frankia alni ACN14a]|uniref:Serine/threonine protein kinase n=1 Tax=Frankia alni (strain DSM 45986 / CECT 9034 / ACN14a) TaxID=326424 RepID=Q0RDI0_FRAAA|nr:putative Serine/threonine protein kinase [Frankia alni ACN14a]
MSSAWPTGHAEMTRRAATDQVRGPAGGADGPPAACAGPARPPGRRDGVRPGRAAARTMT